MTKKEIEGGMAHKVPTDLRKALTGTPQAQAVWDDITPLARNEWICWVTSGKKIETRHIRIKKHSQNLKAECADPVVGQAALTAKVGVFSQVLTKSAQQRLGTPCWARR